MFRPSEQIASQLISQRKVELEFKISWLSRSGVFKRIKCFHMSGVSSTRSRNYVSCTDSPRNPDYGDVSASACSCHNYRLHQRRHWETKIAREQVGCINPSVRIEWRASMEVAGRLVQGGYLGVQSNSIQHPGASHTVDNTCYLAKAILQVFT